MATKRSLPASRRSRQIPVRKIGHEDLRHLARQGLGRFPGHARRHRLRRPDLHVIGIAAVVMTTSGPLMPFFFPVVAGVGLLGPVAAVGFYELARRREEGHDCTGSLPRCPQATGG